MLRRELEIVEELVNNLSPNKEWFNAYTQVRNLCVKSLNYIDRIESRGEEKKRERVPVRPREYRDPNYDLHGAAGAMPILNYGIGINTIAGVGLVPQNLVPPIPDGTPSVGDVVMAASKHEQLSNNIHRDFGRGPIPGDGTIDHAGFTFSYSRYATWIRTA